MLRQLLSNSVGGPGSASGSFEQCSTLPSVNTSFENSAAITTTVIQAPSSSAAVPENQMREWNEGAKNLATLENMSLAGTYCTQAPSTASNHMENFNSTNDLNGTTELFSSTFAMLSADSSVSWSAWDEQARFSNTNDEFAASEMQMGMNGHNLGFPVHTTAPGCSSNVRYQLCNGVSLPNGYIASCQGLVNGNGSEVPLGVMMNGDDNTGNRNYSEQKNSAEKLNQMTQSSFSDAYRRMAHIPVPTGFGEEGESDQVMCMACRGVYSSRRSLTGHIGRNEKCREIIGRNYLDQMGGIIESMQVTDPGTAPLSNGIDPVCPHCDRFISHYKGNIRRHVNQCMRSMRNGSKLRRKDAILKQIGSGAFQYGGEGSSDAFSDSYQPHVLATVIGTAAGEDAAWFDGSTVAVATTAEHEIGRTKTNTVKKDRSNEEPFRCPLCDFATIYKGNMKRHLSTCHGLQDEDLKDGCIDRLRCKETMDSRLENASRGRRPKNMQCLKSTPSKATQLDAGSPSSSASDSNAAKASELPADPSPSDVQTAIPSSSACEQEPEPCSSRKNSTNGTLLSEDAEPEGSLSTVTETPSAKNSSQLVSFRSNTIDEAIEAVIANGVENATNELMSTDGRAAA